MGIFINGWANQVCQIDNCMTKVECITRALNQTVETINHWVILEVDMLIEQVNCWSVETKELNNVTKDLLTRFSAMEAQVHVLEEESIEKAAMVHSLSLEVDFLKERVCCCEEEGS